MPDLQPFTGTIILDNNNNRAYLQQNVPGGAPTDFLLVLDPAAAGGFSPNRADDAWGHYATTPGIQSGSTVITFTGVWEVAPGSTEVILHVVNP